MFGSLGSLHARWHEDGWGHRRLRAFVALLESNVSGSVNIASGYAVTLKDIIYQIADKIKWPELIHLGAMPPSANEPSLLVADAGRLTNEVGWQPNYKLNEGLDRTIEWWKNFK